VWSRETLGEVDTSPAIRSQGGAMLIASSLKSGAPLPTPTRTVYFLNLATGLDVYAPVSGRSTRTTKFSQSPSAVIDKNGYVYQGIGKRVYSFKPDGSTNWTIDLGGEINKESVGAPPLNGALPPANVSAVRSKCC
jgi:outer membrane protein assembly factor BamB